MTNDVLRAVVVALAIAGSGPASAAGQSPGQDSVVGSGIVGPTTFPSAFDLNARSGPTGENASGTAALVAINLPTIRVGSTVTCLNVIGNRAVIGIDNADGDPQFGRAVFFDVTDGAPDALGLVTGVSGPPPTVCPAPGIQPTLFPVISGDIVITDAPPLPTSKTQCTNGGWTTFGDTFKNQGQCVSFVERGPR